MNTRGDGGATSTTISCSVGSPSANKAYIVLGSFDAATGAMTVRVMDETGAKFVAQGTQPSTTTFTQYLSVYCHE